MAGGMHGYGACMAGEEGWVGLHEWGHALLGTCLVGTCGAGGVHGWASRPPPNGCQVGGTRPTGMVSCKEEFREN